MIDQKIIQRISSVKRFSGIHTFQMESIPDHSFEMALLCINMSTLAPELNKEELCYRCILHDLEESITSDIPRPIKHYNQEIKQVIDKTARKMLLEICNEDLVNEIFDAKNPDDVNGFIVGIADRVQCYLKIKREVEYGNRYLLNDLNDLKEVILDLFNTIRSYKQLSEDSSKSIIKYLQSLI